MESKIELMLACPPERDELVVHIANRDGSFWGEIFREDGTFKIRIDSREPLQLDVDELASAISKSVNALRDRLNP